MKKQLEQIGKEIWIYDGSTVNFYGFPFPTRMTVIRLRNGNLWVHSPEKLNINLKNELAALGKVKYLISPNKLHHLFLSEWITEYPEAILYAETALFSKRKDIKFDAELTEKAEAEWSEEIYQTIFRGSPAMEEVVFFHVLSSTLILTDLIENFDPNTLNWWQKLLAQFAGILYPKGKTPLDWRLTFVFGDKVKARKSLVTLLSWEPKNIVISHGECVLGEASDFLKSSFSWLQKNAQ